MYQSNISFEYNINILLVSPSKTYADKEGKMKVLFVCLGNICRSPAAEGVMNALLVNEGLSDKYFVDSAGTSGFHEGHLVDDRMREAAKKRGISLLSRSRKFIKNDFKEFDYIIAMDNSNYKNILKLDNNGEYEKKVLKMCDFNSKFSESEVPDPYYDGEEMFDHVLNILEDSTKGFLNFLEK